VAVHKLTKRNPPPQEADWVSPWNPALHRPPHPPTPPPTPDSPHKRTRPAKPTHPVILASGTGRQSHQHYSGGEGCPVPENSTSGRDGSGGRRQMDLGCVYRIAIPNLGRHIPPEASRGS